MITRRKFIKSTTMAGAAAALYGAWGERAFAIYQSSGLGLTLFSQSLRGVGPGGIPVCLPDTFQAPVTGVTHYSVNINQFTDRLHSNLNPTVLWGYNPVSPLGGGVQPQKHLGGIIVAQKGRPIQITFKNNLPSSNAWGPNYHPLPVDQSLPGAGFGVLQNRAAVHLHGGHVPWISDGGPFDWFAPNGVSGESFLNNLVLNPSAMAGQAEYFYPNDQSARMMWYHDHAFGITRLNAYAGIATAYIIRDAFENNLINQGLPDYVERGGREIPLVIQDKIFVGPNVHGFDPTWPGPTDVGSLWYSHVYDASVGQAPAGPPPDPSCVPEFFADTMLANGTVCPEATVEARRYRIRLLNACNARFLNLQLYVDDGSPNGITLNPKTGAPLNSPFLNSAALTRNGKPTSNFMVIGTEGGFLPKPTFVPSNMPFNRPDISGSLLVAPAERYDMLLDFSGYVGKNIILYTDAPAPFPDGDDENDYFPGWNTKRNLTNRITQAGQAPNTRVIMRFKVVAPTSADLPLKITTATDLTAGNDPLFVPLGVTTPPPGVRVRTLTLNEEFDDRGRLIQMLGTDMAQSKGSFSQSLLNSPTETPVAGSTEIWQIVNLTGDTHPIHFHLSNVQIISRQKFAVSSFKGVPNLQRDPVPPGPEESGWKETVRMNPGEVTTVIMRFNVPSVPFSVPSSPRTGGSEYVWHCHILEHEEHDMMRPMVVL